LAAISELLGEDFVETELLLEPGQGRQRARFYALGVVQSESTDESGAVRLHLRMPRADLVRLAAETGLLAEAFNPPLQLQVPDSPSSAPAVPVDEPVQFR